MIVGRHPRVARQLVAELEHEPQTRFLQAAEMARRQLTGVMGFDPPSWEAAVAGTRPPLREPDHFEPGTVRSGWQHEASARVGGTTPGGLVHQDA